jgi:hypothetical protein
MLRKISKAISVSRAWILLIAFLVAVGVVVESSQPFQECIKEIYYNPTTENFEKSISSVSVAFGVYRDCFGTFTHDNAEAIIAAFTIILALSTIFLWVATRDAARAGNRTAVVAEQALTKLERAFVYNSVINWKAFLEINRQGKENVGWAFMVKWGNTGATIARTFLNHVSWSAWVRFDGDLPSGFIFEDIGPQDTSPRFIAPKGALLSAHLPIEACILEAVRVGHLRLFMWGWVTYRDIFDSTIERETQFCFELDRIDGDPYEIPRTQDAVPHIFFNFRVCGRYNCVRRRRLQPRSIERRPVGATLNTNLTISRVRANRPNKQTQRACMAWSVRISEPGARRLFKVRPLLRPTCLS